MYNHIHGWNVPKDTPFGQFDPTVINETKMRYRDHILEWTRSTPAEVKLPIKGAPVVDPEKSQPVPRRAKLNPGDLARHGYTVGCSGCEQLQLKSPIFRNHIEECRRRTEEELNKTSDGQDRLNRAKDRLDIRVP